MTEKIKPIIDNTHRQIRRDGAKRKSIAGLLREDIFAASEILDGLPDAVMVVDMDGIVRYVNKAFEKLLGYEADELIGISALNLPTYSGKENMEKGAMLFQKVLDSGFAEPVDMNAYTKNGHEIPLSFTASLLRDSVGNPKSLIAVIRDITAKKKTEQELRYSEDKLKTYLENSPDIVCVVGRKGIISYVNKATELITGYSKDELTGNSFTKLPLLAPESKLKPEEWKELNKAEGATRPQEFVIIKKDGGKVFVEVSTLSIGSPENGGDVEVVAIARDITERKHGEDERQRLSSELLEKNRELEQIVYVASHDLRSPLVNVQGFSKELKYAMQDLTDTLSSEDISTDGHEHIANLLELDIADALKFIEASVSKMDSLLAGLLRFSRLGRAALNFEELDMNDLFREIEKEVEYRLTETDAEIVIDDLPRCIGDTVQTNQLFSNLVDNALKYRDHSRRLKIRVTGYGDNGQAVYCVEDSGIGIAQEHQARIFEIFQRLDPDATSGEGLGLSIAKRVVERHSGSIWVESDPGIGSKFFVALPIAN